MNAPPAAVITLAGLAFLPGCGPSRGELARKNVGAQVSEVKRVLAEDALRYSKGMAQAAKRLSKAPLFESGEKAPTELGEARVRVALRALREPPRGVSELVGSPMTLFALVGRDGRVIARDAEPDRVKGLDFGARYPLVRDAIETGRRGVGVVEFASPRGGASSIALLYVEPVRVDESSTYALIAAVPLSRLAERLSRQLRVDHAKELDTLLWVFVYARGRVFTPEPLDLVKALPSPAAIASRSKQGRGFTGVVEQYGRAFGYAVVPWPPFGLDAGFIVARSEPLR